MDYKFSAANLDIVCLQETRLQARGVAKSDNYAQYRAEADARGLCGTHVWIHNDCRAEVEASVKAGVKKIKWKKV